MLEIQNENILFISYLHESGLFYLAKSLYRELNGKNNIFWIPKIKYKKHFNKFHPTIIKPLFDEERSDLKIINYQLDSSLYSNLVNIVDKYKIDRMIFFESLMPWNPFFYNFIKRKCKVIDIPMIEWVSKKDFFEGYYEQFDEIWCLTNYSYHQFSTIGKYKNSKRVDWDYIDDDLIKDNYIKKDKFLLYHQASLNKDFSSKNTFNVIRAFNNFNSPDMNLVITGILNDKEIIEVKKNKNIRILDKIKKSDVYELFKKSGCLLAPSVQEGLGLSYYEAKKFGCKIISTDYEPMSSNADYLCKLSTIKDGNKMYPKITVSSNNIEEQIRKYYIDLKED